MSLVAREPEAGRARRLQVHTDLDPGSLIRILHFFQTRNVTPVCVHAQRIGDDGCVIIVDVATSDLSLDVMSLIAAKIAELPFAIRSSVLDGR